MIKLIKPNENISFIEKGMKVVNFGDGKTYQKIYTCTINLKWRERWRLEDKDGYSR